MRNYLMGLGLGLASTSVFFNALNSAVESHVGWWDIVSPIGMIVALVLGARTAKKREAHAHARTSHSSATGAFQQRSH